MVRLTGKIRRQLARDFIILVLVFGTVMALSGAVVLIGEKLRQDCIGSGGVYSAGTCLQEEKHVQP